MVKSLLDPLPKFIDGQIFQQILCSLSSNLSSNLKPEAYASIGFMVRFFLNYIVN